MILEGFDSKQSELIIILLFACLGFVAGAAAWGGASGGTRYMTVMSARFGREGPKSRIEWAPRGIFTSLLFAIFPFIRGWCPVFMGQHISVLILIVSCGVSAGLWLAEAFLIQDSVETIKKKRVEEFIASAPGNEPSTPTLPERSPRWLRLWMRANVLAIRADYDGATRYTCAQRVPENQVSSYSFLSSSLTGSTPPSC